MSLIFCVSVHIFMNILYGIRHPPIFLCHGVLDFLLISHHQRFNPPASCRGIQYSFYFIYWAGRWDKHVPPPLGGFLRSHAPAYPIECWVLRHVWRSSCGGATMLLLGTQRRDWKLDRGIPVTIFDPVSRVLRRDPFSDPQWPGWTVEAIAVYRMISKFLMHGLGWGWGGSPYPFHDWSGHYLLFSTELLLLLSRFCGSRRVWALSAVWYRCSVTCTLILYALLLGYLTWYMQLTEYYGVFVFMQILNALWNNVNASIFFFTECGVLYKRKSMTMKRIETKFTISDSAHLSIWSFEYHCLMHYGLIPSFYSHLSVYPG